MRPGKKPTPHPHLDLERIWRELNEDPPGPIVTLDNRKLPRPKTRERYPSR
jgi:hypothetical protein